MNLIILAEFSYSDNVLDVPNPPKCDEFKDLVFAHPILGENLWEAMGEISRYSIHI